VLYLLDANVLITASNVYYPLDQIPEFWKWIHHQANLGYVKLPIEILEEVLAGTKKDDPLLDWLKHNDRHEAFRLDETVDPGAVQHVVNNGYASNLTDDEIEEIGRDPFLVAYAMVANDRCVVTTEVSKPSKQRQNRQLPDVCNALGVNWCNPFTAYRNLGFKTSWRP
jgi:Domain of unknown function (DUF4411)